MLMQTMGSKTIISLLKIFPSYLRCTILSKNINSMTAHEIDYRILGEEMQMVEIELDPMETVVAEPGSFLSMKGAIKMKTLFGDGSGQDKSILDKMLSAGKRLITGESLFMTAFTHEGEGKAQISFASPYPGKIITLNLSELGNRVICQKDAFLCAAKGVSVGIEFSRRLGRGFFGGEGFIMQKLEGDGLAFCHAGGMIRMHELADGEELKVDTGCLVAFTQEVDYDIEFIGGIRNVLFGGEGIFFARLRGPGKVWIQSLPINRLADRILTHAADYGFKRE